MKSVDLTRKLNIGITSHAEKDRHGLTRTKAYLPIFEV